VSENELIFLSPEVRKRNLLEALRERAEDRRAERERAAQLDVARGERATADFLAQMRGEPVVAGAAVAGALEQMAAVDAAEDITRRRCQNVLDHWLAEQTGELGDSGPVRALEELLGTRAAATRSAMLDSQARLRTRAREVERDKSHLERRVDQLERENSYLRSQVDRTFEVLAEHEQGRSYR
jgi:hypothetical protein